VATPRERGCEIRCSGPDNLSSRHLHLAGPLHAAAIRLRGRDVLELVLVRRVGTACSFSPWVPDPIMPLTCLISPATRILPSYELLLDRFAGGVEADREAHGPSRAPPAPASSAMPSGRDFDIPRLADGRTLRPDRQLRRVRALRQRSGCRRGSDAGRQAGLRDDSHHRSTNSFRWIREHDPNNIYPLP